MTWSFDFSLSVPPRYPGDMAARIITNVFTNPSFELSSPLGARSWDWVASGQFSAKATVPAEGKVFSHVLVGKIGTGYDKPMALERGKTYTMTALIRTASPLVGVDPAYMPYLYFSASTAPFTRVDTKDQVGDGVGIREHTMTFTVPTGTTDWYITFRYDAQAGFPHAYMDNVMVVEGTEAFSYADGDSPGWSWLGTPHASASQGPTAQARSLPVLDGDFTFDRGWSPAGQGRFTVPLAEWEACGLSSQERVPMYVQAIARNYSTTGTMAAVLPAGSLGTTAWPEDPAVSFDGDEPQETVTNWQVFLRSVSVNRSEQTATLEVQTFELAMHEMVNNYGSWMPTGTASGGYDAADVLVQILRFTRLTVPIEVVQRAVIAPDDMVPWEPGQSAWDYWDRVRLLSGLTYELNPRTGVISIVEHTRHAGSIPAEVLEHEETYAADIGDSETYADSIAVNWSWVVETAEGPVERSQRDVAYASGLSDWRQARRHADLARTGPPVAGYAQRAVDELSRFRVLHRVTLPLTPTLLASVPNVAWQIVNFNFGSEPSATLSILTR